MKIRLLLILLSMNFCSCYQDHEKNLQLVLVHGKIIDSTRKINYTNYEIKANFVLFNSVKPIANAVVDSNGEFNIEYYVDNNYVGNNLKLTFYPTIPRSYKFEYLPYGINWNKNFYLSDSAKIIFKNKNIFTGVDTITLFTNPKTYSFITRKNSDFIGEARVINVNGNLIYKINSRPNQSYFINPTGDPIVDTIILDINP